MIRFRPGRRRLGGRWLGLNLSGLRATSITTRLPFVGSVEWWRRGRRGSR